MKKAVYLVIVISLAALFCQASAIKPAIVQKPNEWTANVRYMHPQQISLKTIDGKSLRYWYMIITVTNNINREVDFYPRCEVLTDTFQLLNAASGTPDDVFNAIVQRHKSTYPFLEQLEKTSNQLLVGSDNAKDIVIVWPDFDLQAKEVKIFISGLSNEIAQIDHPLQKQQDGTPEKIFLRKTLQLDYSLGGDPIFRNDSTLDFKSQNWIMR